MGVNCTLQSNYWSTMLDSLSYLFRDYNIWVYGATEPSRQHASGPPDTPEIRSEHNQFVNTSSRLGIISDKVVFICNDRSRNLVGSGHRAEVLAEKDTETAFYIAW